MAGFERRVSVAFQVGSEAVTVLRILYAGRALNKTLVQSEE